MRIAIILILALFAGTAFAQVPVIDSMLIDESKGILSVYGDFGTAQGKVWCDSVELSVLSWSDSLVTATILDTGKGSAGGVVVENNLIKSNIRYLTYWHGTYKLVIDDYSDSVRFKTYWSSLTFRIRLDIHSRLLIRDYTSSRFSMMLNSELFIQFSEGMKDGYYITEATNIQQTLPNYHEGVVYDSGFIGTGSISMPESKVILYAAKLKGLIGHHMEYQMVLGNWKQVWSTYPYTMEDTRYEISLDDLLKHNNSTIGLPPVEVTSLNKPVNLLKPINRSIIVDTSNITLTWSSLQLMNAYHVQLSIDTLDNVHKQTLTYIVDTIVSPLDFTLPPLEKNTKYYWRVCGVNTEGESRWSEVWSFTTGTSTDVNQARASSIPLACYPNPAMNELTIVTTEPTRLLLYDVAGKIIKSEQATTNETKWDVSLLPNGTYILGTSSGEMQVVQIVK